MIIALFLNNTKDQARQIALQVSSFLQQLGVKIVAEEEEAKILNTESVLDFDPKEIDFRISLGGDGTILRLVHRHPQITAPLLGINLGNLGFLADVPIKDITTCLQDLVDGKYEIQKRIMLEGSCGSDKKSFAVNDIVFHRASNPSLIELNVQVDDLYLTTFNADGIVIATPTGSTAYSLAAGGPILSPSLEACVITPICPHTISNRPIVLFPKQEIKVTYVSKRNPIEVSFDGVTHFSMQTDESFTIFPTSMSFSLVAFPHHDCFSTLRSKLNWTGKLKRTP